MHGDERHSKHMVDVQMSHRRYSETLKCLTTPASAKKKKLKKKASPNNKQR